ncbi:MAG: DUF2079 domain-containing protein [Acutalibacteraceae bacterium]
MKNNFRTSFERVILSLLSGWLITQYFCLLFGIDCAVSVDFANELNIIIFAVSVVAFSLPIFLADSLKSDKNISPYAFVLSLLAFSCGLVIKKNDMYTYIFMVLLIAVTLYCFNEKVKPQFIHTDLNGKISIALVASFAGFACAVTLLMALFRYLTYSTPGYDFGIFCNMFHSMKTDFSMNTTCERDKLLSHLAVHISPIYYLILPIYYIFPSPVTLNVIQPIIIYSGVIPLYLLTKKLGLTKNASAFLCIAFSLYAPLSTGCFYDLHENCFMVPLLLWMFYFHESGKNIPMFIFAVLTLTVKEDAFLYVAIFALYLVIAKKQYIKGGGMLAMSAAYFALCCVILSHFGEGVMESRYSNLQSGGGLIEAAKTIIMNTGFAVGEILKTKDGTAEKFIYIAQMLLPLALIPFRSKNYARYILILPIFVNLLTQYKYQYNIGYQYSFSIAAFLFYFSVLNLSQTKPEKQNKLTFLAVISSALLFMMMVLPKSFNYIAKYNSNKETYKQINEAVATIPDDASVTASAYFVPKLAQRKIIYEDEYHDTPSTEYFVLDIRNQEKSEPRKEKYIDAGYELVLKIDNTIEIYQNKAMANNE